MMSEHVSPTPASPAPAAAPKPAPPVKFTLSDAAVARLQKLKGGL